MVGQLVRSGLADDAREVVRLDVPVSVPVKVEESLADALALQPAQHLGKLWVCHRVAVFLSSKVQLRPVAIPVERDCVLSTIARVCIFEAVEIDHTSFWVAEQAKRDFVFRVRLREDV